MIDHDSTLAAHVAALEAGFRAIASSRMAGLALLHPKLEVQALGFARETLNAEVALGVLVTPWFMSLLRLPLSAAAAPDMLPVGHKLERDCGSRRFEFIGAQEIGLGRYESSSLCSPMFDFADTAAARATALEVLALLRPVPATSVAPTCLPARRSFLFGRSVSGGAP